MSKKALCIQTFVEIIKSKVNVKISEKNFRTNIHVYQFLFDALIFASETNIDASIEAPYIDKTYVSKINNRKIDAPLYYIELAQSDIVKKNLVTYFSGTLCSSKYMSELGVFESIEELRILINNDNSITNSAKKHFSEIKNNSMPADFIAEVWLYALKNNYKHVVGKKEVEPLIYDKTDITENLNMVKNIGVKNQIDYEDEASAMFNYLFMTMSTGEHLLKMCHILNNTDIEGAVHIVSRGEIVYFNNLLSNEELQKITFLKNLEQAYTLNIDEVVMLSSKFTGQISEVTINLMDNERIIIAFCI